MGLVLTGLGRPHCTEDRPSEVEETQTKGKGKTLWHAKWSSKDAPPYIGEHNKAAQGVWHTRSYRV